MFYWTLLFAILAIVWIVFVSTTDFKYNSIDINKLIPVTLLFGIFYFFIGMHFPFFYISSWISILFWISYFIGIQIDKFWEVKHTLAVKNYLSSRWNESPDNNWKDSLFLNQKELSKEEREFDIYNKYLNIKYYRETQDKEIHLKWVESIVKEMEEFKWIKQYEGWNLLGWMGITDLFIIPQAIQFMIVTIYFLTESNLPLHISIAYILGWAILFFWLPILFIKKYKDNILYSKENIKKGLLSMEKVEMKYLFEKVELSPQELENTVEFLYSLGIRRIPMYPILLPITLMNIFISLWLYLN